MRHATGFLIVVTVLGRDKWDDMLYTSEGLAKDEVQRLHRMGVDARYEPATAVPA